MGLNFGVAVSGDDQGASDVSSKVKERTRISSSSLLSNRNLKRWIRMKLKHREEKSVPS